MSSFIAHLLIMHIAFATQNLSMLKNFEWKGPCQKLSEATTQDGQVIAKETSKYQRSSYSVNKDQLTWKFQQYRDSECKKLKEADRYMFNCAKSEEDDYDLCKLVKSEKSTNGKAWKAKVLAASSNEIPDIKVKFTAFGDQIEMNLIGESEDPEVVLLTR